MEAIVDAFANSKRVSYLNLALVAFKTPGRKVTFWSLTEVRVPPEDYISTVLIITNKHIQEPCCFLLCANTSAN